MATKTFVVTKNKYYFWANSWHCQINSLDDAQVVNLTSFKYGAILRVRQDKATLYKLLKLETIRLYCKCYC